MEDASELDREWPQGGTPEKATAWPERDSTSKTEEATSRIPDVEPSFWRCSGGTRGGIRQTLLSCKPQP